MILSVDKEKLFELIKSFYEITGIKVAVYNTSLVEVLSYPSENSCFCQLIRSNKKRLNLCNESNRVLFDKCLKCNGAVANECHAGLTEVAMPIIENNTVLGYIMYGQITNINNLEKLKEFFAEKCEEYNFNKEDIEKFTNEIKFYSKNQHNAISTILTALTSCIILKRLLYSKTEGLEFLIIEYINNNLKDNLSTDNLCKKFKISRSLMYKILKPYMKNGVSSYIKDARLKKAEELLKTTDWQMWKIAEEIGFSDTDYFLRTFKSKYKISAGKFRKQPN